MHESTEEHVTVCFVRAQHVTVWYSAARYTRGVFDTQQDCVLYLLLIGCNVTDCNTVLVGCNVTVYKNCTTLYCTNELY